MIRHYLAAALRHLARSKLYAAINIIGLAAGFAVAILIALFVRDEFSYNRWIPGNENIYVVGISDVGSTRFSNPETFSAPSDLAGWIKSDISGVQAVFRVWVAPGAMRHGDIEVNERIDWA